MATLSSSRKRPPAGPPWDLPWAEAPLVFIDLEMTGLDSHRDRVIQVCIERVRDGALEDRLLTLVRPVGGPFPRKGDVHGIEAAALEDAPPFQQLADEVASMLRGAVFVAHAARYDVAFLHSEYARLEREWDCPHRLDTLRMSRKLLSLPNHRLSTVAESLAVPNPRPHRADNDVAALRGVFDALLERSQTSTPRELWDFTHQRRTVQPQVLESVKRAAAEKRVGLLRYRPAGRKVQEFRFHVTAVRLDLDPPRVLGYLQHTRGRRELRADRILSFELMAPP